MIKKPGYQYLTQDGMPFVVTPDKKNWVFARTTKAWEPAGTDDFDAVYPNWDTYWEDLFQDLPELPDEATTKSV
jgi:hypothetical protein